MLKKLYKNRRIALHIGSKTRKIKNICKIESKKAYAEQIKIKVRREISTSIVRTLSKAKYSMIKIKR